MTHPSLALQKAIYAALIADAAVGATIGDRIYDAPPRNPLFPYASFGAAEVEDWSTGTERGAEHRFDVDTWSRERGKAETLAVMEAIRAAIDDADLTLDGHGLVSLRFAGGEAARAADGVTWRGTVRFRAVTEAL